MMQTQLVKKTAIIESGDFNLSASRYLEKVEINSDYEIVKLKEICIIQRGGSPRPINDYITNDPNGFNWIKIGDAKEGDKYINSSKQKIKKEGINKSRKVEIGDFILSNSMSFGRPYIMKIDGFIHDGWLLLRYNEKLIEEDYLYYILRSEFVKNQFIKKATGGVVNNLNKELVSSVKIPLPPLEIQEQIVKEIEGYQQIIDGCRQVVENYKPLIDIDPSWDFVKMDDFVNYRRGSTITKKSSIPGNIPVIGGGKKPAYHHNEANRNNNVITISSSGAYAGYVNYFDYPIFASDCFTVESRDDNVLDLLFLFYYLKTLQDQIYLFQSGAGIPHVYSSSFKNFKIPLPSFEAQKDIVEKIKKEIKVIEGNKDLIRIYKNKINARISKVWSDN